MHRSNPALQPSTEEFGELRLNLAPSSGLKCPPWIAIGNANHFNIVWNER